jgi:hypothetical protein
MTFNKTARVKQRKALVFLIAEEQEQNNFDTFLYGQTVVRPFRKLNFRSDEIRDSKMTFAILELEVYADFDP